MHSSPEEPVGLEQIVYLTCQHDAEALTDAFVQALNELLSGTNFRLYFRNNTKITTPLLLVHEQCSDADNINQSNDDDLLAHLLDDKSKLHPNTEKSSLIPIIYNGGIYGALICDSTEQTDMPKEYISSLMSVFANQMTLLLASNKDPLTGLFNRQTLDQTITKVTSNILGRTRREGDDKPNSWVMVLMDIDHFKAVNDNYGHIIGDEVLVHLSQIMHKCFRDDDMMFRYGGEEFAVLLKDISLQDSTFVLERFRETVENYPFPQVNKITISIGLSLISHMELPAHILEQADKALYYSKEHGRNQVNCYQSLIDSGKLSQTNTGDIELF